MLKGRLTISRPQGPTTDDHPYVKIAVRDENSRVTFLEIDVPVAEFALALTGLSEVPVTLKPTQLDLVGKRKLMEPAKFHLDADYLAKYNLSTYGDRPRLTGHMIADPEGIFQREGWTLDLYLGSQTSVVPDQKGGMHINTRYYTYVEIDK